ncbi:MAG: hypothetical protein IPM29_28170 [Planctomycetes bacterium]|nr:hypothetical protein [Planctomycetota bacterium]
MRPARLLGLLLASVLAAGGCGTTPAPAPTADVYLLAGQSNMQGLGFVAELPAEWREPVAAARFWNGERFEPLDPETTRLSTRPGEFGPELGFARGLCDAGPGPFYLIKFCRSGQALHAGWDDNRWVGSAPGPDRANFHPGERPDDPAVGRHYRDWSSTARAALAALRAQGLRPVLRGVVWMQGEQDSKHAISAGSYALDLRRLRERLGADLGAPDLPWVYGQVLPHSPARERFTHRDLIRSQMAALDARSGQPEATPGMWMVPTDDMPLRDDTVHYDTEGQRRLGLAFAAAMLDLQRR